MLVMCWFVNATLGQSGISQCNHESVHMKEPGFAAYDHEHDQSTGSRYCIRRADCNIGRARSSKTHNLAKYKM